MKKLSCFASTLLVFTSLQAFAETSDGWVAEEVLRQLLEIKQELKALRADVSQLPRGQDDKAVAEKQQPKAVGRLSIAGKPTLGDKAASVAIVEFTDYECPYCYRYAQQTFPRIKENFVTNGKVLYVTSDFPLGFHAKARGASIAARCAGEQDAFWPMHEALFDKQRRLERPYYEKMAKAYKLDMPQYMECLDADRHEAALQDALAEGSSLKVSGTPAFYVGRLNGTVVEDAVLVVGAQPYGNFANVLNQLLQK